MFAVIEDFQQSGLTRQAYCAQNSIAITKFHYWQKKYRNQDQESQAGFISVRTGADSRTGFSQPIILTYPNGISLQLPTGTSLAVVSSLLRLA